MKLLLGLLTVLAVVWLLRAARRGGSTDAAASAPQQPVPQAMVRCAHCGVHLPQTDAVEHGDRAYCSMLHRLAGPRAPYGTR
jgi:uncharacterized protein